MLLLPGVQSPVSQRQDCLPRQSQFSLFAILADSQKLASQIGGQGWGLRASLPQSLSEINELKKLMS